MEPRNYTSKCLNDSIGLKRPYLHIKKQGDGRRRAIRQRALKAINLANMKAHGKREGVRVLRPRAATGSETRKGEFMHLASPKGHRTRNQILKLPTEVMHCTNPATHRENAMSRTTFTFRVEEDLKENFASVSKSMNRTGAQLLRDCMRDLVRRQQEPEEHDAWFREQVRAGLDSANADKLVPHEKVEEKFAARRAETRRELDMLS